MRPKSGASASYDFTAGLKEAKLSCTRRPRLISAESFGVPAWDALHLVPPSSCLLLPRKAHRVFASDSADEGFELFRALSDAKELDMCLGLQSTVDPPLESGVRPRRKWPVRCFPVR